MLWKALDPRPFPAGGPGDRGGARPSPGLSELLAAVGRMAPARVLDLGPAQESTVRLLAERRLEVHVAALEPDSRGRIALPEYEDGAFAGILAWDYLVRMRSAARLRLATALSRWLRPGGGVLLILPISSYRGTLAYRFRTHGPSQVEYIPQAPLDPTTIPSTRKVLEMFADLECSGARILRHGAREFVLRKPRDVS